MSSYHIHKPVEDYTLKNIDILSLIFDSEISLTTDDTVMHIEAACPHNKVTKPKCREYTERIAYVLREAYGIGAKRPGTDVVTCISTGHVLLPSLFYGVMAAGGVYSAASPSFTVAELAKQLQHGESGLVIASDDCKEVASQAALQCGLPRSRVLVLKSDGGERSLHACCPGSPNLLEQYLGRLEWERVFDPAVLREQTCALFYSSGTTGDPKGVRFSQQKLTSSAQVSLYTFRDYLTRQEARLPDFKLEYRTIAHLPVAHIAGCQGYLLHPALCAGTVYWMPRFQFPDFLSYCKTYRITFFFTVPPIYQLLVNSPLVTDQFQHMIHTLSGAALMDAELAQQVEAKLHCTVSQTWGMSETTGSVTLSPWDTSVTDGSLAPLLSNMRLRLVDDNGVDVAEGQVGEFLVQGPMVTPGYWKDESATREAFTADGNGRAWLRMGDLGYVRDGKFFIADRKKEVIKYKGLQVAPTEVEALLRTHSLVKDAAVVGVPDPNISRNELPRAYIVAGYRGVTAAEIEEFVKINLASFKHLRGGVVFIDAIPKSLSGKILRRLLKEGLGTAHI
ncbi:hypothetical protein BJX66DRAFT_345301 [Aspergillus keveii]|uniref:Adenylate-forming enzyme AfeA n=1 Tax=Aspergillus keveii TaxID=714993 RepID=A0ABR4FII8_9EURO